MTYLKEHEKVITTHHFLDETGDATFFSKGKNNIIGRNGVSTTFAIGMVKIDDELKEIRQKIIDLQQQVAQDDYLNVIPSVKKKIKKGGFYFHATDDPPEVREIFYKFIKSINCSLEIIVARKISEIFIKKHNGKENEFYADVLSHLLTNKLKKDHKLVLNIAKKGSTTDNKTLEMGLQKALVRAVKKHEPKDLVAKVSFNVQNHYTEPLLNIADYLSWSVQRVFERGETRYYDFIRNRISLVLDLYDSEKYKENKNYYNRKGNYLTSINKISPPSP